MPRSYVRSGVCIVLALVLTHAALAAVAADASQLIDRNATDVGLAVDASGDAMLTYRAQGAGQRVLAWGASGARRSLRGRKQVRFRLDYTGGEHTRGPAFLAGFRNVCGPYRGPDLPWLVTACTAPDGTNWAVQSWQRALPVYGLGPTGRQGAWELRLSHWRGPTAVVSVGLDWTHGRFHHLFGRFTYRGFPVFGLSTTRRGNPLDHWGRNVYIDTFNSAYGPGWRRENGILTHAGTGSFCYAFFSHRARPSGMGERYRITVSGPGVTPDVMWQADAPVTYSSHADAAANQRILALGDGDCQPN
jgi:hypothetical protein